MKPCSSLLTSNESLSHQLKLETSYLVHHSATLYNQKEYKNAISELPHSQRPICYAMLTIGSPTLLTPTGRSRLMKSFNQPSDSINQKQCQSIIRWDKSIIRDCQSVLRVLSRPGNSFPAGGAFFLFPPAAIDFPPSNVLNSSAPRRFYATAPKALPLRLFVVLATTTHRIVTN